MENQVLYHGLHFNCKFEAFYDKENHVLHILDWNEPERKSVTNAVDKLLDKLESVFNCEKGYRIFLYGTDGIISEYSEATDYFRIIEKEHHLVFPVFSEMLEKLYN